MFQYLCLNKFELWKLQAFLLLFCVTRNKNLLLRFIKSKKYLCCWFNGREMNLMVEYTSIEFYPSSMICVLIAWWKASRSQPR